MWTNGLTRDLTSYCTTIQCILFLVVLHSWLLMWRRHVAVLVSLSFAGVVSSDCLLAGPLTMQIAKMFCQIFTLQCNVIEQQEMRPEARGQRHVSNSITLLAQHRSSCLLPLDRAPISVLLFDSPEPQMLHLIYGGNWKIYIYQYIFLYVYVRILISSISLKSLHFILFCQGHVLQAKKI